MHDARHRHENMAALLPPVLNCRVSVGPRLR